MATTFKEFDNDGVLRVLCPKCHGSGTFNDSAECNLCGGVGYVTYAVVHNRVTNYFTGKPEKAAKWRKQFSDLVEIKEAYERCMGADWCAQELVRKKSRREQPPRPSQEDVENYREAVDTLRKLEARFGSENLAGSSVPLAKR